MTRSVPRFAIALLLFIPVSVHGQTTPQTVTIPSTRAFELRSSLNGRDYRLFVSLPEGYEEAGTVRYPVLYVLDGNGTFPIANETHRLLRIFGEVEEIIIVGVGYDANFFMDTFVPRWTDYTPTRDETADTSFARQFLAGRSDGLLRSGGARDFHRVLGEEIIPFVEARFRTTADRGLWGHSFGGLFALYVLLEEPGSFKRYAINSPSLWWNQREILAREADFAQVHRSLETRVFLSVGEQEGTELFTSFVETLRERKYELLELTSHVFSGETHASVVPAAMSRSLRVLYGTTTK